MGKLWTRERTQLLVKLVDEGILSCDQLAERISKEFDVPCSKNAITGKINRLGLQHANAQRKTNSASGKRAKRDLSSRGQNGATARKLYALHRADAPPALPAVPVPKLDDTGAPEPFNISLFDLTDATCRWATNDASPFLFCGHRTQDGSPYCGFHSIRAFDGKSRKPVHVPERLLGKRAA